MSSRPRAPHLGPDLRRPEVLQAACEIAVAGGLDAVSISGVADRLGVSRPVVYACYVDHESLLAAVVEEQLAQVFPAVEAALRGTRGAFPPTQAFADGFKALLHAVEEQPGAYRILVTEASGQEARRLLRAARRGLVGHARDLLAPVLEPWWGITDGEEALPVLVDYFMASCVAAVVAHLADHPGWDAQRLADFYGRATCQGMAAAGPHGPS